MILIAEFSIVLLSSLLISIGFGLLSFRFLKSPVFESKIFLLGLLFFGFYFLSVLPSAVLNTYGEPINETSISFFKLSPVFAHVGVFLMMMSILLPTISHKYEYTYLFLLVILSFLTASAAILNYQTIGFTILENNYLLVSYNSSISLLLMFSNATAYVIVMGIRIRNVSTILKNRPTDSMENRYILSFKFFLVHFILVVLCVLTLILTRAITFVHIPAFTWFLPLGMIVLYLCWAVYQDDSFLFITTAKFDALLISDKDSGLSLLTKNFQNDSHIEAMLSNLLSAVNMSLKINLQSQGNLESVAYGDKVVVAYSGEYVTSFLIVTQSNFITTAIAKYVTKQYERKFKEFLQLTRKNKLVRANIFKDFDNEIDFVRRFIPL